jgi:UDP-glucose 4-epimerase
MFRRSHVVDLAEGHVAALNHIFSSKQPYCDPINLGTGTGTSVLEMIKVCAQSRTINCSFQTA